MSVSLIYQFIIGAAQISQHRCALNALNQTNFCLTIPLTYKYDYGVSVPSLL